MMFFMGDELYGRGFEEGVTKSSVELQLVVRAET